MSPEFIAIIVVGPSKAADPAFLRGLHRDVVDLRWRMARLEGFTRCEPAAPETGTA